MQDKRLASFCDKHKHCTMQPFGTAFGGPHGHQTFEFGAAAPIALLSPSVFVTNLKLMRYPGHYGDNY